MVMACRIAICPNLSRACNEWRSFISSRRPRGCHRQWPQADWCGHLRRPAHHPHPLCMHRPTGDATTEATFFRKLVTEETIGGFVVGLPVHADGSDSRLSVEVERFGAWLKESTGCPLVLHDERYSSQEAVGSWLAWACRGDRRRPAPIRLQLRLLLLSCLKSQVSAGAIQRSQPCEQMA